MSKQVWDSINPEIRSMIVAAFKLANIDFERDYVRENDEEKENFSIHSPESPWLTREEAAAYTKCSTDTVDNWISKGHIQRLKTDDARPGRVLIDRSSLERFLRGKLIHSRKCSHKTPPVTQGGRCVQSPE